MSPFIRYYFYVKREDFQLDSKIKIVIADDHEEAVEIIEAFVQSLNGFEVVGTTSSGDGLLDLCMNLSPHLVITDIHMPNGNGIEAIESCLKINPDLKVIFTTAFHQYAVNAFELNAVDYVMKPIKKERLYLALEKAKGILQKHEQQEKKRILTIKMDRVSYFIPFDRIIFFEVKNRKTIIHTINKQYETNESLDQIFSQLDDRFFRSHRSFIVSLNYISHITFEKETYFVHFRDYPEYAHASKLQKNKLVEKLSSI